MFKLTFLITCHLEIMTNKGVSRALGVNNFSRSIDSWILMYVVKENQSALLQQKDFPKLVNWQRLKPLINKWSKPDQLNYQLNLYIYILMDIYKRNRSLESSSIYHKNIVRLWRRLKRDCVNLSRFKVLQW